MFDKRTIKKFVVILLGIMSIVFVFTFIKRTFSRYESKADSIGEVDVAFWIVSDTVQEADVFFENLKPGQEDGCTISVSNYNGTVRAQTAMEYEIIVTATTNLPLDYALYINVDGTETECTVESEEIYEEDGTYYKEVIFTGMDLGFEADETDNLVLKAIFPQTINDALLSDLIDSVEIKIDAKQKIV